MEVVITKIESSVYGLSLLQFHFPYGNFNVKGGKMYSIMTWGGKLVIRFQRDTSYFYLELDILIDREKETSSIKIGEHNKRYYSKNLKEALEEMKSCDLRSTFNLADERESRLIDGVYKVERKYDDINTVEGLIMTFQNSDSLYVGISYSEDGFEISPAAPLHWIANLLP